MTVKEKEEAKMHVSAARENKHISLRSFEGQTEQRGFPLTMQYIDMRLSQLQISGHPEILFVLKLVSLANFHNRRKRS